MKKLLIISLAVLTLAAMGFANGQDEASSAASVTVNPPGTFPIVDETIHLTGFGTTRPNMDNMNDNDFGRYYMELTNVQVDWTMVPENDARTKANLMIASGDYQDIMTGVFFNPSQQIVYGEQGILQPLEELIDEYAPNLTKGFELYPQIESQSYLGGHIYGISQISACYHCMVANKLWINQEWLDKLGLDTPTTTEEFEAVLRAFKTQDPNGNGLADEIPYMGCVKGGWNALPTTFLMNAFIYNKNGGAASLAVPQMIDGQVDIPYDKDAWREGLKWMNKLSEEGLFAVESFTIDNKQLQQIGENPDAALLGSFSGGVMTGVQQFGESGRWLDYAIMPPLAGPDGTRYAAYYALEANAKAVITDKCDYPAAAVRFFDELLDEEMGRKAEVGEEGVEWRWIDPSEGIKGINGEPARWEQMVQLSELPINKTWNQVVPKMETPTIRLSRAAAGEPGKPDFEVMLYEGSKAYHEALPPVDFIVPPLPIASDDASEFSEIETALNDYVKESTARFIVGDIDVDSDADWNSYLSELDAIGLERYKEIARKAYASRQ